MVAEEALAKGLGETARGPSGRRSDNLEWGLESRSLASGDAVRSLPGRGVVDLLTPSPDALDVGRVTGCGGSSIGGTVNISTDACSV